MQKETSYGNLYEEDGRKRFGLAFGRAIEYEIKPSETMPNVYNVNFKPGIILAEDEQNWKCPPSKLKLLCQCIVALTNVYGTIRVYFSTFGEAAIFKRPTSYFAVKGKVDKMREDYMIRMDIY